MYVACRIKLNSLNNLRRYRLLNNLIIYLEERIDTQPVVKIRSARRKSSIMNSSLVIVLLCLFLQSSAGAPVVDLIAEAIAAKVGIDTAQEWAKNTRINEDGISTKSDANLVDFKISDHKTELFGVKTELEAGNGRFATGFTSSVLESGTLEENGKKISVLKVGPRVDFNGEGGEVGLDGERLKIIFIIYQTIIIYKIN